MRLSMSISMLLLLLVQMILRTSQAFQPPSLVRRTAATRRRRRNSRQQPAQEQQQHQQLWADIGASFGDQVLGSLEDSDPDKITVKESALQYQAQQQRQGRIKVNNDDDAASQTLGWKLKQQLLQLSNYASILCVVDCTVLPLLTVLFPLLGWMNSDIIGSGGSSSGAWLHTLGHNVAWYFVVPVGTMASILNYTQHQRNWIAALAWTGLVAVAVANSSGVIVATTTGATACCGAAATTATATATASTVFGNMLSWAQHGVGHRLVNLLGCALLFSSNLLAKQFSEDPNCRDPNCALPGCGFALPSTRTISSSVSRVLSSLRGGRRQRQKDNNNNNESTE